MKKKPQGMPQEQKIKQEGHLTRPPRFAGNNRDGRRKPKRDA